MGHATNDRKATSIRARLEHVGASEVATTLQALATPSRLRILAHLQAGPCGASHLAEAAGLEQSACSHQLRLLRNLGLVTAERQGRSVIYALYDNHVAELLEQALFHVEHLRLGLRDTPLEQIPTASAAPRS